MQGEEKDHTVGILAQLSRRFSWMEVQDKQSGIPWGLHGGSCPLFTNWTRIKESNAEAAAPPLISLCPSTLTRATDLAVLQGE